VSDVTQLLDAIDRGDPDATSQLLPLVYNELRKLAAQKMAHESPGQTLEPTALVHEAYLRLVGGERPGAPLPSWDGRGHFFAAAAEAMRRILVERARQRKSDKRGGDWRRADVDPDALAAPADSEHLLALDEALNQLTAAEPQVAELVKLRYFAGLTIPQAAAALGIAPRTADGWWAYARAWLLGELRGDDKTAQPQRN
jgi:RNA polymerase sigma factor (TIGR02999 family)